MFKILSFVVLSLSSGTIKSQIHYHLTISNLTIKNFEIDINHHGFRSVPPSKSLAFVDSLGFGPMEVVTVNIKKETNSQDSQRIQLVAASKSEIYLEISDIDSIDFGNGFKLSGLPFPESQAILLSDFFPKKSAFNDWIKIQYAKARQANFSGFQKDSILENIRTARRQYLFSIEKMIQNLRESYASYLLFHSEFLVPKSILAIGKEKIISMFQFLDTSYKKTGIGEYAYSFVNRLKSNAVGAEIRNFRFKTMDDAEYNFHDYIGDSKALLIFTARGCKACVEQVGIINKIKRQHRELKIIYVSLDKSVRDWRLDVGISKYPGITTLNLAPYNYNTDLQELFMIEFIPQLFLINENRKIIYDNLSPYEDEKLIRLQEMLNESKY